MEKLNLENVNLKGYAFVSHVKDIETELQYNVLSIFDTGYHGQYWNVVNDGNILIGGYKYNLKHILKRYIVDTTNGLYKYYAPNKTLLRKCLDYATYGNILNIIEIKN